jgi:hypothetical protein
MIAGKGRVMRDNRGVVAMVLHVVLFLHIGWASGGWGVFLRGW